MTPVSELSLVASAFGIYFNWNLRIYHAFFGMTRQSRTMPWNFNPSSVNAGNKKTWNLLLVTTSCRVIDIWHAASYTTNGHFTAHTIDFCWSCFTSFVCSWSLMKWRRALNEEVARSIPNANPDVINIWHAASYTTNGCSTVHTIKSCWSCVPSPVCS